MPTYDETAVTTDKHTDTLWVFMDELKDRFNFPRINLRMAGRLNLMIARHTYQVIAYKQNEQ
jgi:hypothetical protein